MVRRPFDLDIDDPKAIRVSVPLRGFWYADVPYCFCIDDNGYRFSPLTGILVRRPELKDFLERAYLLSFQSPYGDFGTLTVRMFTLSNNFNIMFQSPYGDFGTLTNITFLRRDSLSSRFSPLTGILVL